VTDSTAPPEPEVSVVAPCHNEEANLQPLCDAIRAALEPLQRPFEIVLVDDCSTDGSWETIRRLGRSDPLVRGLRFARNRGQSAALWAGVKAARGRIVVTLDADLQNPPAEIPRFLAALDGADCVCGSRVAARARGDGLMRRLSSRVANAVRNRLSDETISDAGCCFRAFRRECVAEVKFFRGAHRFLPTLIRMEGFTVAEIPIGHAPRNAGRSHYGVWNRLFSASADLLAVRWMKKRHLSHTVADRVN
jgi:glycosyltransferase involved in cell wall biosynthesis